MSDCKKCYADYAKLFKKYPDVVNVKTLCKMLHIGERKAYALIHSGAIQAIRFPHGYRIPKPSVIQYLYQNTK